MSHHGSRPSYNDEIRKLLDSMVTKDLRTAQGKLQGEYPSGRLNTADEGAIAVAIGHENGAVVMKFPHPTAWIGFTPEQAEDIARALLSNAKLAVK